MNRKYEFTGEIMECMGRTLHRIRAVRDFGDVKAGDLGGWIEKERNLSHAGDAWVRCNAKVCDSAVVGDSALVCGDARVEKTNHILTVSPIGSRNDVVYFMRTKDEKIFVIVGCFAGTIEEFDEAVKETHGDNEHGKAYRLAIELAKLRIGG